MKTSLSYLFFLAGLTTAIIFEAPAPTPLQDGLRIISDRWTPQPTKAPTYSKDLLRRQSDGDLLVGPDNICGYISGSSDLPFSYVDTDCRCAFSTADATSDFGMMECCSSGTCELSPATCIDYDEYWTSSLCDSDCLQDPMTLACTEASAPYCAGIEFSNPDIRGLFCDVLSITTWRTAYTTYLGEAAIPVWSTVAIDVTETSSRFSSASASSIRTSSSSISTSNPASHSSSSASRTSSSSSTTTTAAQVVSSSASSSGGSSSHLGAIIGGAVGGVVVIALIVAGTIIYLKKHKRRMENRTNLPPPMYNPPPGHQPYAYSQPPMSEYGGGSGGSIGGVGAAAGGNEGGKMADVPAITVIPDKPRPSPSPLKTSGYPSPSVQTPIHAMPRPQSTTSAIVSAISEPQTPELAPSSPASPISGQRLPPRGQGITPISAQMMHIDSSSATQTQPQMGIPTELQVNKLVKESTTSELGGKVMISRVAAREQAKAAANSAGQNQNSGPVFELGS